MLLAFLLQMEKSLKMTLAWEPEESLLVADDWLTGQDEWQSLTRYKTASYLLQTQEQGRRSVGRTNALHVQSPQVYSSGSPVKRPSETSRMGDLGRQLSGSLSWGTAITQWKSKGIGTQQVLSSISKLNGSQVPGWGMTSAWDLGELLQVRGERFGEAQATVWLLI